MSLSSSIFLVLVLAIIFLCYRWYKRHFSYWSRFPGVPSVPDHLFGGDFLKFLTFKTNFIFATKSIYDDPKYRNEAAVGIYTLRPALLIRDPELIKSVLIKDFDCFRCRPSTTDVNFDPVFAHMLFFSRYGVWKELRPKLSYTFTSGKLKQMFPLLQHVGENLETFLLGKGDRFVCNVKKVANHFTMDVISSTICGINCNSLENPKEYMYLESFEVMHFTMMRGLRFMFISFAQNLAKMFYLKGLYVRTDKFLRKTTNFIVNDREKSGKTRNDMIDIFVKLKQEAEADGQNMKEFMDILAGQMAVFIGGGFDTSSTTISYLLFEIAKQTDIQDRLRQEILKAFIKGNGCITYEALNDLEYLGMVVDETLRMYPVFPLLEREYVKPHPTADDYTLKPYDFNIPDGMAVYISSYAIQHDPQYWPNPSKFDPERFSPDNKKAINPMVYLPFGNGPRNCIGNRLGLLQVKECIVHFLKNHRVQLCEKTNLQFKFNTKAIFLQPEGGMHLEVIRDDLYNRAKAQ